MSVTSAPTKVLEVFYSYAHEDERLRKALDKQLSLLKRDGLITAWYDHKITAGKEWENEILTHLNSAQIILLLISPDFIASDYCYSIEMQRAMERHESGEARVIPIILRPADWKSALFGKLKVLPSDGKAITRWPNRDEAFLNVAKGIRKAVKELTTSTISQTQTKSMNSSPSPDAPQKKSSVIPSPFWNVPYKQNPFFTGREEIFEQLYKTFKEGRGKVAKLPQALSGLGGVGKTQTAVEYAYRYRDEYQAVLWARAESQEVLISDFITLAGILQLTEKDAKEQQVVVDAVKNWLNSNTNWLLILDNIEDLEMITSFIPSDHKGHILLTTRIYAMSGWAQRVLLETMSPGEGAFLLLRRANLIPPDGLLDEASEADLVQAEAISRTLDGLPLGLDQAGAYIEETSLGLSNYLELYQSEQRELLKRRGKQAASHPEPVIATWSLSLEKVERANVAAADLLRLCAFLYPDAIPDAIITGKIAELSPGLHIMANNPIKLNEAIEELLKFSLIKRDPNAKTLTIHRLIQAALKEQMDEDTQRQWAERAVRAVSYAFPDVEFSTWPLCQQYLPHAIVCRTLIEQWKLEFLDAAELFYKAGYYSWNRSQYTEAELFLQSVLAIREKLLGPENLELAQTLNLLGVLYSDLDQNIQAEPLLERALAIREKLLDQEDPKVAESLHDLGSVYENEGKVSQGEALARQAVVIREKMLGREHPDTARSLHILAKIYYDQGKYIQSEHLQRRALAIQEKLLGRDHPDTAASLSTLAVTLTHLGNLSEAEQLARQALAIRENLFGQDHLDTAISLKNLADILLGLQKYIQAQTLAKRALSIIERALGLKHYYVAECIWTLALIYTGQKNIRKAEPLYQQSIAIYEKALGQEPFQLAYILSDLGSLYLYEKKFAKAEPCYERAVAIFETVFGGDYPHPDLPDILDYYAALLRQTKRTAEAIELASRAQVIRTRISEESSSNSEPDS